MVLRDSCMRIRMLCGSTFSLLVSISFMMSFSARLYTRSNFCEGEVMKLESER